MGTPGGTLAKFRWISKGLNNWMPVTGKLIQLKTIRSQIINNRSSIRFFIFPANRKYRLIIIRSTDAFINSLSEKVSVFSQFLIFQNAGTDFFCERELKNLYTGAFIK